jgi:NADPH2:quinone reductase
VRALELHALEGPDGFAVVRRPSPVDADAIIIDVRAAGVSFPDLLMSRGRYQFRPELPAVLGSEVAGTVRSAPRGNPLRPGDRVWAAVNLGGFAEIVAAPPDRVFPLAEALSFEQGAALGGNFLTAVFALKWRARLSAGETVLVLGAAGGLGTASISVARALGARVVAVVSIPEKVATAKASGADEVVVGRWREEVLKLTGGRGVDVVADIVGGPETLEAVRTTAPGGRVLVLGYTAGEIPSIATNRLLLRNVSLVGAGLGALVATVPELVTETATELNRLIDEGVRPVVGTTLTLDRGAEAIRRLEARTAQGKLVLTVDKSLH